MCIICSHPRGPSPAAGWVLLAVLGLTSSVDTTGATPKVIRLLQAPQTKNTPSLPPTGQVHLETQLVETWPLWTLRPPSPFPSP